MSTEEKDLNNELPPLGTEEGYQARIKKFLEIPGNNAVLAMFLQDWRPAPFHLDNPDNMTSREICEALEDSTELTTTEVAYAMSYLGYRLHRNAYRCHEWAMKPAFVSQGGTPFST